MNKIFLLLLAFSVVLVGVGFAFASASGVNANYKDLANENHSSTYDIMAFSHNGDVHLLKNFNKNNFIPWDEPFKPIINPLDPSGPIFPTNPGDSEILQ